MEQNSICARDMRYSKFDEREDVSNIAVALAPETRTHSRLIFAKGI